MRGIGGDPNLLKKEIPWDRVLTDAEKRTVTALAADRWAGIGETQKLLVIFIGAVHDFSSLIASVRHQGRSVAEMMKENIGERAWLPILAFIWIALVYVMRSTRNPADVTSRDRLSRL